MKERIVNYISYMDEILAKEETEIAYQELLEEHLVQIRFFMHERLIHLLVTILFAVLTFATFLALYFSFSMGLMILCLALLVLLVPYILHYYLLENGVQKMYRQYDLLLKRMKNPIDK